MTRRGTAGFVRRVVKLFIRPECRSRLGGPVLLGNAVHLHNDSVAVSGPLWVSAHNKDVGRDSLLYVALAADFDLPTTSERCRLRWAVPNDSAPFCQLLC
ncbi:hypothetical protein CHELA20_40421 [Hyphomicrobiales bacterium]|nr:hypothetical protein CHELA20_40421 [Hyphomicrobiales bacterium]CAH1688620.1 hypothetical protein CHELA41_40277 [Hyphomicrobiales bacterium]